ncbi:MAG: UPF0280 family protein [Elusimicrobia bacterium]|nr:UPF0280 family protein [Elusimicrobiota bacterium]
MIYVRRNYRNKVAIPDLDTYEVRYKETDLSISTRGVWAKEALSRLIGIRSEIEAFMEGHPTFRESMDPVKVPPDSAGIIREMADCAEKAGVGPMASVAGAIAEDIGISLSGLSDEVIIENGGDIYLWVKKERNVAVFAGDSSLSMKLGLVISPQMTPCGVCTSSGKIGHSISYGNADAVVCVAASAALADAAATSVGNRVICRDDIEAALEFSKKIPGIAGCLIIAEDKVGISGDIEICKLQ